MICLRPLCAAAVRVQAAGFMYSKEEMLQIYRDGHFTNAEFADKFSPFAVRIAHPTGDR